MRLSSVRAMIVVHYFGLPQPMTAIRRFCDEHRIALIEDCAHALFGQTDDQPIGSTGDYAIASLAKFLPTTDGGCLVGKRRSALPRTPRKSAIDELRSVANALEIGARNQRLRGLNGLLTGGFTLAGSFRVKARDDEDRGPVPENATTSARNPRGRIRRGFETLARRIEVVPVHLAICAPRADHRAAATQLPLSCGARLPIFRAPASFGPSYRSSPHPTYSHFGWTHPREVIRPFAARAYPSFAGTTFGQACRQSPAITAPSGPSMSSSSVAIRISVWTISAP